MTASLSPSSYYGFLVNKSQLEHGSGFPLSCEPDFLFDFQRALLEYSAERGRSAIFADCGLGKTPIQLVWADNVVRHTNGRVLIIAPLAVSQQTVHEGEKFGIEVGRSRDGRPAGQITITNYEQLDKFDTSEYEGVVCDESSAIKHMTGKRRKLVTAFMRKTPYRLLCTATAAPNDYVELGTSSEALGYMGQMDMLHTFFRSTDDMNHVFFKNGDFWNKHKWMFKAHAEQRFWRWVCSWARAIRKPSDLGFDDGRFVLPGLQVNEHVVENKSVFTGELFPRIAVTLSEQREERRMTMTERCDKIGELVSHDKPAIVWCHLNDEGDVLESAIPESRQVKGAQSDEEKEEILDAFSSGELRVLVTKPSIAGFGMNWQHCAHMTFFPSHSFEQWYQGVRRCWRFGQEKPVVVDVVTTPGEAGVTANLNRKANACERMFESLVAHMNEALELDRLAANHTEQIGVPSWLS